VKIRDFRRHQTYPLAQYVATNHAGIYAIFSPYCSTNLRDLAQSSALVEAMHVLSHSFQPAAPKFVESHSLRHRARTNRSVTAFAAPEQSEPSVAEEPPQAAPNKCAHCGVALDDVPFGCDQMGHKAGGMGALFEWWPVKAWGPCERASAAGLPYTRKGQGTDEMLFGSKK
jgi:hypothetical protein